MGFDAKAYRQTESYVQAIDALYNKAVAEFSVIASKLNNVDPDKPFSFSDYPGTTAAVQQIVNTLAAKMQAVISKGSRDQWLYACKKNDEFIASILNTTKLSKARLQKYQNRNLEALKTFQSRKVNGMDLAKRVWNYTGQLKTTMELGIDVAIGEGKSAAQLSRELKKCLVDPDHLFRRVRDKRGNLQLSKAAKALHPGQGVYRSSHKNAMRLTRSEINMAYKESDQLRWQQLDFVVGFEVKLSNNHTLNGEPFKDICDKLAGKYPKSFKFKGWHPQCRCLVVPILQDRDEFNNDELADLKAALNGKEYAKYASRNTVTDVPDNFKEWASDNAERSKNWVSQPYFVRDNFKGGTIDGGLKFDTAAIEIVKPVIDQPEVQIASKEEQKAVSKKMPADLLPDSNYLKGKQIEFKKDFFDLIDESKPIKLTIAPKGKSSYYVPGARQVHIVDDSRNKQSNWHKERVIYHEYGHAIDDQRGLKYTPEVKNLMGSYKKKLGEKSKVNTWVGRYDFDQRKYVYTKANVEMSKVGQICARVDAIYKKIYRMSPDVFTKRGITKHDVIEQIGSFMDTIKSINNSYGWGHSTSYFRRPGMKETEFLAHCFENAFVGNSVFKKYMPDLYEEMIRYARSLK